MEQRLTSVIMEVAILHTTWKTGNNFLDRPIEPEKSYTRFFAKVNCYEMNLQKSIRLVLAIKSKFCLYCFSIASRLRRASTALLN